VGRSRILEGQVKRLRNVALGASPDFYHGSRLKELDRLRNGEDQWGQPIPSQP
jgi:hypothetical protein